MSGLRAKATSCIRFFVGQVARLPELYVHCKQERKRERRRLCLGETNNGRLLTFVVTERQGQIRFVTAYPMPPQMREIYRGED